METLQDVICVFCQFSAWTRFTNLLERNSYSMDISPFYNPSTGQQIPRTVYTGHDSCATVSCAKFGDDHFDIIGLIAKWNFNWIWITTENMLVKWARALNPSAICISGNIRSCYRGTGVYTMCTVPSPHVANLRPKLHAVSILLGTLYFHTLMVTDYISCLIRLFHAPQTGCSRDLHQRKSVTLRMIWSYWI